MTRLAKPQIWLSPPVTGTSSLPKTTWTLAAPSVPPTVWRRTRIKLSCPTVQSSALPCRGSGQLTRTCTPLSVSSSLPVSVASTTKLRQRRKPLPRLGRRSSADWLSLLFRSWLRAWLIPSPRRNIRAWRLVAFLAAPSRKLALPVRNTSAVTVSVGRRSITVFWKSTAPVPLLPCPTWLIP